jgi:uncharacterized glyoxalase superfamily protein PhnB
MPGETVTFYPTIHYRDAPAAIAWLERVFGITPHLVVPAEDGSVAHAELRLGDAFVMCASLSNLQARRPGSRDLGGTASLYAAIPGVRAHHDRAVAEGATILIPYEEKDYGGAGYTALDNEGNEWSFGGYRPGAD